MMAVLADYRADLDGLLGTVVDSATWTTVIQDEALRQTLAEYDDALVYEADFTVSVAGSEQDLSTLADVGQLLGVAWPWAGEDDWRLRAQKFRFSGKQTIILPGRLYPQVGDVIRVRYTRLHQIENLDSAAVTTVQEPAHRRLVSIGAAAWALDIRLRQVSENPAIPKEAAETLRRLRDAYRDRFDRGLAGVGRASSVVWGEWGLGR
jgi:hypothetical protein